MILFDCDKLGFLFRIASYLLTIMMYIIPIVLILLVTIDVAKIVINADEKNRKDNMEKIGKRLLYAIIIFLIPTAVKLVFNSLAKDNPAGYGTDNNVNSWKYCYKKYFE